MGEFIPGSAHDKLRSVPAKKYAGDKQLSRRTKGDSGTIASRKSVTGCEGLVDLANCSTAGQWQGEGSNYIAVDSTPPPPTP